MERVTIEEILILHCKIAGRYGILCGFPRSLSTQEYREIFTACPMLSRDDDDCHQMLIDEFGYFLYDTREEMETDFKRIIGDETPGPWKGPRVYALTCSPDGLEMENT